MIELVVKGSPRGFCLLVLAVVCIYSIGNVAAALLSH